MTPDEAPRAALPALWVVFFLNGAVLASWAPRIPAVTGALGISDAALGLCLLGVAVGSVPALFGAGALVPGLGARRLCVVSGLAFPALLPLIALARNAATLFLALTLLGVASGLLDVAMNTAAIEYQRAVGRPVVSRLHGGYSGGVLTGSAGGAAATRGDVPVLTHFLVVALLLVVALAVARPFLPPAEVTNDAPQGDGSSARAILSLPLAVAAVAVSGLLVEGMVTDWSALLVGRDLRGGTSLGSATVVAFSAAMFASRSAADRVIGRFGNGRVLLAAGLLSGAALATGTLQPSPVGMAAAVALSALGLGPVFPAALNVAAARSPGAVAGATAAVSAVGYLAFLGGPPAVGFLADLLGLPRTVLSVATVSAAVIIGSARSISRHDPDTPGAG